jgi:hypothetical protein
MNPIAAALFASIGTIPAMLLLKAALIGVAWRLRRRVLINCACVVYGW